MRKSFDSGRNSTGMCAFHVDCPLRVAPDDPGNLLTNAARLDAFAIKIQPQFAANVCQFTVKMADSHAIQGLEQELAAPDGFLKAKLVINWLT